MTGRKLTLRQCRFLGDHLNLERFEQLATESPLAFLRQFASSFKFHVPFTMSNVAANVAQHGKLPSFTVEEAESDVLTGRGGCCMAIAPFVVELLQGLGFRSHVMEGFHTGHKQYYHYAAIVRDVVTPGDVYYIDVGTFPPFTRCMDITNVIEQKTNGIDAATLPNQQRGGDLTTDNYAPLFFSDFQFHYQLANGKRVVAATNNNDDKTDNRYHAAVSHRNLYQHHGPMSTRFNFRRAKEAFIDSENPLTLMMAKTEFIGFALHEEYNAEPDGVWLPQYVFPTPLTPHDLDISREIIKNPDDLYTKFVHKEAAEGICHAGFGQKSGDFLFFSNGRLVRIRGVGVGGKVLKEDVVGERVQEQEQNQKQEQTHVKESDTVQKESNRQPTAPVVQMSPFESYEEILALMHEEFPSMTDLTLQAIPLWPKLDKK